MSDPGADRYGGEAPDRGDESASAVIHDSGYKRYDGPRKAQSVRYQVIVGNAIKSAWRGWWRMKLWIGTAAITLFVLGTMMVLMERMSGFRSAGLPVPMSDALVPWSFEFLSRSGFFLTLTVGSSIIASDLRTGALVFYFSRPLRPIDYAVGKLLGAMAIMGLIFVVGPVLLALFRVGLSSRGAVLDSLIIVPKAMLVGAVATVTYAALPLAFSAISARKRYTVTSWAAFYIVAGLAAQGIAANTGITELTACHVPSAIHSLAFFLFGVGPTFDLPMPPVWAAFLALAGYVTAALGFVLWRVQSLATANMGGGS